MTKISTSPRYVIDMTGTDPISLKELWGGGNSEKLGKIGYVNLRTSDRILMKFDI